MVKLISLFCVLFSFSLPAQEIANIDYAEIQSEILNQKRPLLIYMPRDYEERNLVSFDVIYVFDSQHRESFDLVHSLLNYKFSNKQFIVVGVPSPAYPELEYYRNSDFLPQPINVSLEEYGTQLPNAENFWKYVEKEVFTYVNKNYRTTNRRFAVGHSLSASFVFDKAINETGSFTGFIAISPNLSYDDYRIPNDFEKFNFLANENKFLYISQANELETWDEEWKIGYEKIKKHKFALKNTGNFKILFKEFPNKNHWNNYPYSLMESLESLNSFMEKNPAMPEGELKKITFRVQVLNQDDEAFIAGNQIALGNWNPSEVKLEKISELEREITLELKFPLEFKITRGSWESQAFTDQTSNDGENIVINNVSGNIVNLKVNDWNDRQDY